MKKLLIVSPHFPPINAPDMQRARLALPFLRAHGWEPVVLAVAPECVEGGVHEPLLEQTYPADVRIVRARGILPATTRRFGIGHLWWRCGRAIARAGAQLLAAERFDLVFFSTTQFHAFTLGPAWRARFGVPYVIDYQDPWVNDYYRRTGTRPPGGRLKYALSQRSARRHEPRVLAAASGVVAVSEAYLQGLARAYPAFAARLAPRSPAVRALPFGASRADFDVAARHRPARPLIDFEDGQRHHVYAGRCGPDMARALTILFRALRRHRDARPAEAAPLRLHFIGTGYAAPPLGEDTVMPVARQEGVADVVHEHRHRVPYFDALHYLQRAAALMAIGSDDATYAASKIFPYLLAERPLLALYHERSPALQVAREAIGGVCIGFDSAGDTDALAAAVQQRWFAEAGHERRGSVDPAAFAPYSAAALTAELVAVFEAASARAGADS